MQLWRLKIPKIYCYQAGGPKDLIVSSMPEANRLKIQEKSVFQFKTKIKKTLMSQFEGSQAGGIVSHLGKSHVFVPFPGVSDSFSPGATSASPLPSKG